MKILTLIFLLSMLSGCMYQSVNMDDIYAATKKCAENHALVVDINANWLGYETVTCSDRKKYHI